MSEPGIQSWDLLGRPQPGLLSAPAPDETWKLAHGTAWVYRGFRNERLVRPVILADGFRLGPSNLDELWFGVNPPALFGFPFATELRNRGYDVILLGYDERSASILKNAEVAIQCIQRATAERVGDRPLVVGGFSMGGLVTRYALAKLETQRMDHQTATYLSYDSPHRGAWIPIGVQALAHFVAMHEPAKGALSALVNSPAARQLLWRHIDSVNATPREDPLRTDFRNELDQVGGWPTRPRLLGVAAGRGDGTGNGVPPGAEALRCTSGNYAGTVLYTQAKGDDVLVGELVFSRAAPTAIRTSGIPELDGAPGGTLPAFPLAAEAIGVPEVPYQLTCFVPTVSATATADLGSLDSPISLPVSELDDFRCSSVNLPHSAPVTEELGTWILGLIDV